MINFFSVKFLPISACVLVALTATSMPVLGESVDVLITSELLPAACTPVLGSGGSVDYGYILAGSLSVNAFNPLPIKQIAFSINCDTPAKVAIRTLNGRVGSLAGSNESAQGIGLNPTPLFGTASGFPVAGLGRDGTTKIGGYAARVMPGSLTTDGVAADGIFSRSSGTPTSWSVDNLSGTLFTSFSGQYLYRTWASLGTVDPIAFESLNCVLEVQAYLNRAADLDLGHAITLDGLATIEIVYL